MNRVHHLAPATLPPRASIRPGQEATTRVLVSGPRVMLYSHDSYGLGHLRRTLALASQLRVRWPGVTQLIVTGASRIGGWAVPEGADLVKLPAVVKVGADAYEPRALELSLGEVCGLRRELVLGAARLFRPDVLIVDHVAEGLKGEMVATLRHLRAVSNARLVLGLRDVVDEAPRVRRAWQRNGVYELLDNVYDRVLVYGSRDVFDVVAEYGLSPRAARKTRYVGYLRADAAREPEEVRRQLELRTDRFVLVTVGGGGDGFPLLRAAAEALREDGPGERDWLLVSGPLMCDRERAELERLMPADPRVRLLDEVGDLSELVAAADAVVSMGGYNTTREILSHRRPALIVPRVEPRQEQLIRANALAERGLVRVLHPADLSPHRLSCEFSTLLAEPPSFEREPPLGGLDVFVDELEALLAEDVLLEAADDELVEIAAGRA